ncbi:hypothetical protein [Periweissella fabalis]|nr:hypothetical protein [Periweissella fabalis]
MKRTNSTIVGMKKNNNNKLIKLIKILTVTFALMMAIVATNNKHAEASVASDKATIFWAAQRYYHWDGSQQYYLNRIITRESGWNINARNGRYYGLFQTTNVWGRNALDQGWQGMNYIRARYGSPYWAWMHILRTGWY